MVTKTNKKAPRKKATKKTPAKKNPVGRPTDYDPSMCEIVIENMALGYSKEAVAGILDISKSTLYERVKKYPEFSNAVHRGDTKSQFLWEGKAIEHAVHTKDGKRLDSRIYALQMKNRFGWSDKKEIELGEETKKTFAFALDVKPTYED